MQKVLVIAYYFPPMGLSGVQRTLKFVKYLPAFGWEPTVLTVEHRNYFASDESLLRELDNLPVNIIRTKSIDPFHFRKKSAKAGLPSGRSHSLLSKLSQAVFIPDNKIGWKRHAVKRAKETLSETKFDLIFATAPPYTAFLIGAELKAALNAPLVFDYRDAWLENPLHLYPTPMHRLKHRSLERKALRSADHVVTINRVIKESILRNYPSLSHSDVSIIPQGFDAEDFRHSGEGSPGRKLRILHSGTFYYNRTPRYFFQALKSLIEEIPEAASRIEAVFLGTWRDSDNKLIEQYGLGEVVRVRGYLPHTECVAEIAASDVLWLIIGSGEGAEMMSTGKLYEYIGAEKPILACIPEGTAKRTLKKHGAAYFAEPESVEAIHLALKKIYGQWKQRQLPSPAPGFASAFERKTLTGNLAKLFSSLTRIEEHARPVSPENFSSD